jgi:hypothetical protein
MIRDGTVSLTAIWKTIPRTVACAGGSPARLVPTGASRFKFAEMCNSVASSGKRHTKVLCFLEELAEGCAVCIAVHGAGAEEVEDLAKATAVTVDEDAAMAVRAGGQAAATTAEHGGEHGARLERGA